MRMFQLGHFLVCSFSFSFYILSPLCIYRGGQTKNHLYIKKKLLSQSDQRYFRHTHEKARQMMWHPERVANTLPQQSDEMHLWHYHRGRCVIFLSVIVQLVKKTKKRCKTGATELDHPDNEPTALPLTDIGVNHGLLCSGLGDHFSPAMTERK